MTDDVIATVDTVAFDVDYLERVPEARRLSLIRKVA